jgi:DNA replication protein DnaC
LARLKPIAEKNRAQAEEEKRRKDQEQRAENIANLRAVNVWNAPQRQVNRHLAGYGSAKNNEQRWHETSRIITKKLGSGGSLIALLGTRGPGKTQLAVAAMFLVTEQLRAAKYATAMEVFLAVKKAYKKDSPFTEEQVCNEFIKPSLLVIDEVHERGETPWEDRILTHIIDRRYRDEKDTILIANQLKEEFVKTMGVSVVTRLNETGGFLVCDWESFRQ